MAQLEVMINGRPHLLACADGEEARLRQLADFVDGRMSKIARSAGNVGDAKLFLLTALMLADELAEMHSRLHQGQREADALTPQQLEMLSNRIAKLASHVDGLSQKLAA